MENPQSLSAPLNFPEWHRELNHLSRPTQSTVMHTATPPVIHRNLVENEFLPHTDALLTQAYYLTRSEADAQDLVQDTFVKAVRFQTSYQEGSNARAWLGRILHNEFINRYRRKQVRPREVELEERTAYQGAAGPAHLAAHADAEKELFQNGFGDEVTTAMMSLKDIYREPLVLHTLQHFKYEEIAEIIDVPVGTVRSRINRAKNLLKAHLEEFAATEGYQDKRLRK